MKSLFYIIREQQGLYAVFSDPSTTVVFVESEEAAIRLATYMLRDDHPTGEPIIELLPDGAKCVKIELKIP